ncbi:hypothetical protein F4859DRAFT_88537 [Xylaria cf. heliscus]|nr:hypothetical protein F4859DRAFT_88537 [Xylaria cf. heliscus]
MSSQSAPGPIRSSYCFFWMSFMRRSTYGIKAASTLRCLVRPCYSAMLESCCAGAMNATRVINSYVSLIIIATCLLRTCGVDWKGNGTHCLLLKHIYLFYLCYLFHVLHRSSYNQSLHQVGGGHVLTDLRNMSLSLPFSDLHALLEAACCGYERG